MHFIRLLDAVGKANKYFVIQTLLCDFFLQVLYICILEWKYILDGSHLQCSRNQIKYTQ